MKTGLATWHYPHRTTPENLKYFASHGFESLSVNGDLFVQDLADTGTADKIASVLYEYGSVFTVHYCLPRTHD